MNLFTLVPELNLVRKVVRGRLELPWGRVDDLVEEALEERGGYLCAAIFLLVGDFLQGEGNFWRTGLSNRTGGSNVSFPVSVAAAFCFFYFGFLVHREVGRRTPDRVLMGDYLYTSFFDLLSQARAISVLPRFAALLAGFQEEAVRRIDGEYGSSAPFPGRERAALFEEACYVAGIVQQAPEDRYRLLAEAFYRLGLAWEAAEEGGGEIGFIRDNVDRCRKLILRTCRSSNRLGVPRHFPGQRMLELVDVVSRELEGRLKLAAG